MVERFLSQTSFVSQEDYRKNLHIRVPENFNFGYDVVDAYAAEQPGKETTRAPKSGSPLPTSSAKATARPRISRASASERAMW